MMKEEEDAAIVARGAGAGPVGPFTSISCMPPPTAFGRLWWQ